jgi:hypothetical protein
MLRNVLLTTLCLSVFACSDPLAARYQAQLPINNANFGEDGRLSARIDAGLVPSIDALDDRFVVTLRSSVPAPSVTLDNGTLQPQPVELRVTNTLRSLIARARRDPLPPGARRDPRCGTPPTAFSVDLQTLPPERDGDALVLRVQPDPCSRIVIEFTPPPDAPPLRVLIAGAALGDRAWFRDVLEVARDLDVEWVQLVGEASPNARSSTYRAFLDLAQDAGVALHSSPGPGDVRPIDPFRATFGPTDALTSVGRWRWLILDTADARIIEDQRTLIARAVGSDRPGVAFVSVPPLDPVADERRGFARRSSAVRLIELLGRARILSLFASNDPNPGRRTFGEVDIVTTGGSSSSDGRELLLLTLPGVADAGVPCDGAADCPQGEACAYGTCRAPCRSADACPPTAPICRASGWCSMPCEGDDDCDAGFARCDAGSCVVERRASIERIWF